MYSSYIYLGYIHVLAVTATNVSLHLTCKIFIYKKVMNIISCLFTFILYVVGFGLHAVGTCEVKCS